MKPPSRTFTSNPFVLKVTPWKKSLASCVVEGTLADLSMSICFTSVRLRKVAMEFGSADSSSVLISNAFMPAPPDTGTESPFMPE